MVQVATWEHLRPRTGLDDVPRSPTNRLSTDLADIARIADFVTLHAHLDKAAAKAAARKIYRRKARELHPDVAVPRDVKKEVAERAFSELANHYAALDDL